LLLRRAFRYIAVGAHFFEKAGACRVVEAQARLNCEPLARSYVQAARELAVISNAAYVQDVSKRALQWYSNG
jgi:hypothetical protein